jgi:hypothetical protein
MLSVTNKPIVLSVIKLSVIKLSVIKLSVIKLSVIKLSVIKLSVIMLSVVMLNIVMLNVGAACPRPHLSVDEEDSQVPGYRDAFHDVFCFSGNS